MTNDVGLDHFYDFQGDDERDGDDIMVKDEESDTGEVECKTRSVDSAEIFVIFDNFVEKGFVEKSTGDGEEEKDRHKTEDEPIRGVVYCRPFYMIS